MDGDGVQSCGASTSTHADRAVAEGEAGAPAVAGEPGGDDEGVEVAGGAAGFQQEAGFGGLAHALQSFYALSTVMTRRVRTTGISTPAGQTGGMQAAIGGRATGFNPPRSSRNRGAVAGGSGCGR